MADTPAKPPSPEEPESANLIEPPTPLALGATSPPEARSSTAHESTQIQPQEINPQNSRQEFLWKTHSYVNEYIRFSDTKVGFAITLSGALLGLLSSTKAHELFVEPDIRTSSWLSWCSLASFLLLAVAVLLGVWAIRPRLWGRQDRAFIYWGGVSKFQNHEAFSSEFQQLSGDDLVAHLAHHVFELSVVCASKYFWVSASILVGVLGGILAALVVVMKPVP